VLSLLVCIAQSASFKRETVAVAIFDQPSPLEVMGVGCIEQRRTDGSGGGCRRRAIRPSDIDAMRQAMECVANRVSVRVALIGKGYALVLAFL
jgi:hypothetical protein